MDNIENPNDFDEENAELSEEVKNKLNKHKKEMKAFENEDWGDAGRINVCNDCGHCGKTVKLDVDTLTSICAKCESENNSWVDAKDHYDN